MGFWSKLVGVVGVIAAPFTGGLSLIATAAAVVAPKLVDKVVDSVIGFVMQPFMGLLGPTDAGLSDAEAQRQQGVLVTRRGGGAEPIPVVYGMRQVGGIITFAETGSTNNKYLWVAYVFSEGCVEGLYEVRIDDIPIPESLIGQLNYGQTVTIKEGKFKDRVTMRWSPGVYWNNPSSSYLGKELKAALFADSPSFKESMIYNGLATLFVRYEWLEIKTQADADANPFNGQIPDVSVTMMGRRVASLVTTASESAAYEGVGYAERYSTNPAEILLDYLRNPRYGKGLKNTDIDWASFRTAASKCNTTVTYTATGTQGPIMTCNYVLSTNYTIFDNVKLLLQNMRAYLPYVQGRYKLKIEDAGNPSSITSGAATIVAECRATPQIIDGSFVNNTYEIMGEVQYNGIDRSSKYNQVVVTYVDPNNKWSNQQAVFPATEADRLTYITEDGGRENKLETTFPAITNYAMAYDFARLLFYKSRYQETCTLRVSSHAFELEPGDNIKIISKVLQFFETPWRVINITYNNDYTFSLSCVRNPDWLYPYTTAFEPDIINPVYVPKGVDIYYPPTSIQNISLIPPTRQPYIPGVVVPPANYNPGSPYIPGVVQPPGVPTVNPVILNPVPTNPTDPTGGGVGAPGGPINTNPINNDPAPAPVVQPLDDVVDFTNVTYVSKNGLVYARLTFAQPDHAMYAGLDVYYKTYGQAFSVYNENTLAGINKTIVFDLGPLAIVEQGTNYYDVYARVRYTDGQLSTLFTRLQLNPKVGDSLNPSETVQISKNAWPDTTRIIEAGRRDTKFETITTLVNSIGSVGDPRTMSISIVQDIKSSPANYDVDGVRVYWKRSIDTYWKTKVYKFASYVPGTSKDIGFDGDIGVVGAHNLYDFAYKFTYKDGAESSYVAVTNYFIQSPYSVYPYSPSYGSATASNKLVSSYPIITEDQAPAGAVLDPLDIKMTMDTNSGIRYAISGTATGMSFYITPPPLANRADWRGTKIRYRPVTPGLNTTLETFTDRNIKPDPISALMYMQVWGMAFDQKYEIIITPQVVKSGIEQDSKYSIYGVGYVHNRTLAKDYPLDDNWGPSFGFVEKDTSTALNLAGQAFSAGDPTVDIISLNSYATASTATYKGFRKIATGQVERTEYVQLVYNGDKIPGLSKLYIYRRERSTGWGPTGGDGISYSRHWGIGRWERVEITHSGTGNKTVNLRLPTSYREFNSYYQVPGYSGTTYTDMYRPLVGESAASPTIVPICANGGQYSIQNGNFELLIVAVVGTTVSAKGHFHRGYSMVSGGTVDLINPNRPEIITYASDARTGDSSYVNGLYRRVSEARTTSVALTAFDQYIPRQIGGTTTVTQSLTTPVSGPAIV